MADIVPVTDFDEDIYTRIYTSIHVDTDAQLLASQEQLEDAQRACNEVRTTIQPIPPTYLEAADSVHHLHACLDLRIRNRCTSTSCSVVISYSRNCTLYRSIRYTISTHLVVYRHALGCRARVEEMGLI